MLSANLTIRRRRPGSLTRATASSIEHHRISRRCFSSQLRFWRDTSSANTSTLQGSNSSFLRRLRYLNQPIELEPTSPDTPASSIASCLAQSAGERPGMGQPFGTIHRRVVWVVTSRISISPRVRRQGKAAYCTHGTGKLVARITRPTLRLATSPRSPARKMPPP